MEVYNRRPFLLSAALTKIGGLIGLLEIVIILLSDYHRKQFEKQIEQSF